MYSIEDLPETQFFHNLASAICVLTGKRQGTWTTNRRIIFSHFMALTITKASELLQ